MHPTQRNGDWGGPPIIVHYAVGRALGGTETSIEDWFLYKSVYSSCKQASSSKDSPTELRISRNVPPCANMHSIGHKKQTWAILPFPVQRSHTECNEAHLIN